MRNKITVALQSVFCFVCIGWFLFGQYPPVDAQSIVAGISAEDAVQDHSIEALEKNIDSMKMTEQKQWDAIQANSSYIAGLQGEERILGGVLVLIQGGIITLTLQKKKRVE